MGFTANDDINLIQASDTAIVGAGGGDDIYVVWADLMTENQKVTISDSQGGNTLRLVEGLTITSSLVAANAVQLILSNGAEITVLGASSFSFAIGGDAFGSDEVIQDYATFVTDTMGLDEVPAAGFVEVQAVEIVEGGSTGGGPVPDVNEIVIPIGSEDTYNGTDEADLFIFDAEGALAAAGTVSQATVDTFDVAQDVLQFNLPNATGSTTLDALDGQQGVELFLNEFTGNTLISFGNDSDGDVAAITLSGVTDASLVHVDIV